MVRYLAIAVIAAASIAYADEPAQPAAPDQSLDRSAAISKKFLEAFQESGVPTPKAVEAARAQAFAANTVEAWNLFAKIANSYANVLDSLSDHYARCYQATRGGGGYGERKLIETAAKYETERNTYLELRNGAYLQIANMHLAAGDPAKALSMAITAIELSGDKPNEAGENLVKQIVQYDKK